MNAADKIAVVHKYIQAVTNQDVNLLREIYADDATVEDPVCIKPFRGIAGVVEFYTKGFRVGAKLELTGPVRCAGNSAAFPFCCTAGNTKIQVIDVFEFNTAGKVVSMRAYWGPENVTA